MRYPDSLARRVGLLCRLPISPRSLPVAAKFVSTPLAMLFAVLTASLEAVFLVVIPQLDGLPVRTIADYFGHLLIVSMFTVPVAVGVVAIPVAILMFFVLVFDRGELPIVRAILLTPMLLLVPAFIWGACHACHAMNMATASGPPVWSFQVFRVLGAPWLLLVFPLAFAGIMVWASYVAMLLKRPENLCRKCEYPLIGIHSDRCPECGEPFERRKGNTAGSR